MRNRSNRASRPPPNLGRGVPGSSPPRPLFVEQLASRLGWLVGLRLSFLTLLFGLTASFYLRSGFPVGTYSNRVLLGALVANYVASATYYVALKRRRHVVKLASVELVVDQATWTALIYVTGGATSGATALYGLTCLAGAILMGPRGPLVAALAAGLFYFLLCAAFVSGALGVPPDQPLSSYVVGLGEVIYPFFINLMVLMGGKEKQSGIGDQAASRSNEGLAAGSGDAKTFPKRMGCAARSSFLLYFNKLSEKSLCAIDRIGPLALLRI